METPKNDAFRKENYHFQPGRHEDKKVIWISFPYDHKLVAQLRAAAKVHWSRSQKKWYAADHKHYRNLFGLGTDYIGEAAPMARIFNPCPNCHYLNKKTDVIKIQSGRYRCCLFHYNHYRGLG